MASARGTPRPAALNERAEALAQALRDWWDQEQDSWEADADDEHGPEGELWNDMPVIHSMMVARSSGLFEQYLGEPLQVDLIRPGGYESIDEMIDHLVPEMVAIASEKPDTGS